MIQARMGSTRLPGKVLRVLGDRTVLAHVVERVRRATTVDAVVVATTTLPADDAVVEECQRLGVAVTRGSEEDVLARYVQAFEEYGGEVGVRVTSDCPLLDPAVVDEAVRTFLNAAPPVDYVSNTVERTYPRGYDVEVFATGSLRRCLQEARDPADREHVTRFMYRNRDVFRCAWLRRQDLQGTANWRLTLDTEADWRVICAVFRAGEDTVLALAEVEAFLLAHPEILAWNRDVQQKT